MRFWAFPFLFGCMFLEACSGLSTEWVLQMHYSTPADAPALPVVLPTLPKVPL